MGSSITYWWQSVLQTATAEEEKEAEPMGLYVLWDKRHDTAPVFSVCTSYVLLLLFSSPLRAHAASAEGQEKSAAPRSPTVS